MLLCDGVSEELWGAWVFVGAFCFFLPNSRLTSKNFGSNSFGLRYTIDDMEVT